jgi:hypothetical protein
MKSIKLTTSQVDLLLNLASHVNDGRNNWYYIPYWFKQGDGSTDFEIFPFNKLPKILTNHIEFIRNIEHEIGKTSSAYYNTGLDDNQPTYSTTKDISYSQKISGAFDEVKNLLLSKNKAYGNSVFEPLGIFNKATAQEAVCARIDDKLARIKNRGLDDKTEDTLDDLIGYFILLKIIRKL